MSKAKAKPRSLDLDEEAFLGHRAAAAADGLRASLRGRRFRATRHWAGNVADAYLFEFEDGLVRRVRTYEDREQALTAARISVR